MQSGFERSQTLLRQPDYDLRHTLHASRAVSLWRLITGYQSIYVVATVCLGLAALTRAGSLFLLRYFVDTVLLTSNQVLTMAPWYALGFVLLAVVQGGGSFWAGKLAAQTAEGACCRIRNYLYDHLQHLSFTFHDKMQTGDLLQRATSDVEAIRKLFATNLTGMGRIVMMLVVYLTGMCLLHWQLTLISLAIIPIVIGLSLLFFPRIQERYEAFQQQEAQLSTRLQENLSGMRVVRAFVRQEFEKEITEGKNRRLLQLGRRLVTMYAAYWPVTDILTLSQTILSSYLGARMVMSGEITVGVFLAFTGMLIQLMFPVRNLGRLITQFSIGWVSYQRIAALLEADRETMEGLEDNTPASIAGDVRFHRVDFAYEVREETDSETPATTHHPAAVLHQVSLHARPGQIIALLGPTGSGKSTLVSLLPRFYEYTSGQILLDGLELRKYPKSFIRRNVGIVQQEPFLFSTTIRNNLLFGVTEEIADEQLYAATRAAYIHDAICEFPDGYDTEVGEKGVTLSGGQKQRITIARTLLKNPRILILDDALSAVDVATEARIRAALKTLMQSRTTFIIGHRIQSIMHADQILVLDEGRIVQRGTHAELSACPGLYQDVYRIQSRIEDELQSDLAQSVQPSVSTPGQDVSCVVTPVLA